MIIKVYAADVYPDTIVEIAREGFRKCNEVMAPFSVLLWREAQDLPSRVEPDDLPEEEMIGNVPCWAYDMHVREGNAAMARFLESDCETTKWVNANLSRNGRVKFMGGILFRIESGLVANRFRWKVGDDLRRMAEYECPGLRHENAREIAITHGMNGASHRHFRLGVAAFEEMAFTRS